jgi:hypothetical protein
VIALAIAAAGACSDQSAADITGSTPAPITTDPAAPVTTPTPAPAPTSAPAPVPTPTPPAIETPSLSVDDIPVAHTPPGGYGDEFPEPILAGCSDALVDGAPDLRGVWKVTEVTVEGRVQVDHPAMGAVQRIEQCADRVTITSGGIIHDMRADGTEENGVRDVAQFDFTTELHVIATFEDGVHVLRPIGVPVEIRRWREGADLMWQYVGFTARLQPTAHP